MIALFAITTRGLEDLSLNEIAAMIQGSGAEIAYRRVHFDVDDSGGLASLLRLRTVDDVFVQVAVWDNLAHTRQALADIRARSAELDLRAALRTVRTVREIAATPAFSVTANFVGRRNYTMPEIKTAVRDGIESRFKGWHYCDDDADAGVNLRVFIDHDRAIIGVRLGDAPLYRRPYKGAHLPGSLKPTAAAAMLYLAEAQDGHSLLDPFCGGGTILIEGAQIGMQACGGDLNPEALASARQNARDAGVSIQWAAWDAAHLPLPAESVDRVVSNLPWGRQIAVDEADLARLYARTLEGLARVLKPGGRSVLLTTLPHLLHGEAYGLHEREQREISLFGQNPVMLVLDKTWDST